MSKWPMNRPSLFSLVAGSGAVAVFGAGIGITLVAILALMVSFSPADANA